MTTAAEEMRSLLTDLKVPAKKADTIMERFDQLLADASTNPGTVWVAGSRPAVEVVEAYGLEIGVDVCGNAEWVSTATAGLPQGFDLAELIYEAQSAYAGVVR
jgi:hypothetical protein